MRATGQAVAALLLPAFAGPGLVRDRGEPGPGHQGLRGREPAHIEADLGSVHQLHPEPGVLQRHEPGTPVIGGALHRDQLHAGREQLLRHRLDLRDRRPGFPDLREPLALPAFRRQPQADHP